MVNRKDLESRPWWNYLEHDLKELLDETLVLAERSEIWEKKFHDYSFVVFPAAKSYEGFLKKLFLDMGFISDADYSGKRFRIGKALNPNLSKRYRKQSVYDKLSQFCGGKEVPDQLWDTWRQARNVLFHWFPGEANVISYDESIERVTMIIDAIDKVFGACKIKT